MFCFYLSSFHALYFVNILVDTSCIIRDLGTLGVTRNIQVTILISGLLVYNPFIGLGSLLEVVLYYLLIEGIVSLSHQDKVPMVPTLVCMVTH